MALAELEHSDGTVEFTLSEHSGQPGRDVATVLREGAAWVVRPADGIASAGLSGRFPTQAEAVEHVRRVGRSGEPLV